MNASREWFTWKSYSFTRVCENMCRDMLLWYRLVADLLQTCCSAVAALLHALDATLDEFILYLRCCCSWDHSVVAAEIILFESHMSPVKRYVCLQWRVAAGHSVAVLQWLIIPFEPHTSPVIRAATTPRCNNTTPFQPHIPFEPHMSDMRRYVYRLACCSWWFHSSSLFY